MSNPKSQNVGLDLFNIFNENILYDENIHSDIIAYFLGWNRQKTANRFPQYKDVLKALLSDFVEDLSVLVNQMNFEDVLVKREANIGNKGRMDIFIEIRLLNGKHFALVIENKIVSFEHGDQLQTYYEYAINTYPHKSLLILLSPKNIASPNPNFKFLSYKKLAQILQNISSDDEHIQAFINLYCLCLNQVSNHIPSKFQDYLAVSIKRFISEDKYSEWIGKVGSYNNTWIDFEPNGWDEIIRSRWQDPLPEDGIWGFSFHFSQANGLTLEFYFLDKFSSFYEPFYQRNKQLPFFLKPERVGQGSNIWTSIYRRPIISREDLDELGKAYLVSDTNEALAEAEGKIKQAWQECMNDFSNIRNRLEEFK